MHRALVVVVVLARVAHAQSTDPSTSQPPATTSNPATPAPDTTPAPEAPTPQAPATPAPAATAPATPAPEVTAPAPAEAKPAEDAWTMRLGGYVQPQFRMRQNSPVAVDEDGFRFARARLTATAAGTVGPFKASAFIEAELQPTFTLIDAYATLSRPLSGKGVFTLDAGQTRVPISRQQLMSDSRLSFVDKAQLATIAPDRDLGARAWFVPPGLPQLRVIGGVFNGEGKNQIQNINEKYLYAGRVEVTPFGGPQPYQESAFVDNFVSVGVSAGYNGLTPGEYRENVTYLGADISGAFQGLSGSVEYLQVKHKYEGDASKFPGPDYDAQGWMAQAAYLLPMALPPAKQLRFEVGARVEEIDRNDTVPIPAAGDAGQSVREYTGVLSLYLRQHLLKAQLALSHFQEIETKTSTGTDATYDNDQLMLQITYRVE